MTEPFLPSFFAWQPDPGLLLYGEHDPWLVMLSVCVAMFASTMGLHAAAQARRIGHPTLQNLMLLAGCIALGSGVWAMHFIGMLSFRLCIPVRHGLGLTLLSMLPSMGASWVALRLFSQAQVSWRELLVGGTLVGAGIGTMHYTGMAAMQVSAALRYDPWVFALSIAVAVGLAVLALWLRFGMATLLKRSSGPLQASLSGMVMGLAISGMHYTGMAAARFIGSPTNPASTTLPDAGPMALGITLITVVASVLVAATTGLVRYRQLTQALQANEAQLRAISGASIDGMIVLDDGGIVREFNAGAERLYQLRSEQVVGRSIAPLMIEPYRSLAQANFHGFLQQVKFGRPRDTLLPCADGSEVPIRLVIGHARLGDRNLYVAFLSDLSERVRMEEALRHSEEQFRSLIANIPGITYRCVLAPGWPLVFISDAVERLTGYPARQFLGEGPIVRLIDLVHPDEAEVISGEIYAAVAEQRPYVLEFRLRHRDGSWRWMWGNGRAVFGEQGQPLWLDGIILDITARRETEEALRQAKLRAEDAVAARTAFLANMSHEIRTPMNAVIGFTEVVLSGTLEDAQRQQLQTVRRSARSLLVLLNDILDTSKLERGAVELEHIGFALPDLVRQLTDELALQARRKGLSLSWSLAEGLVPHRMGDPYRLRQVLLNLLGNAIKFTDHGGVSLHIDADPSDQGGVHITVRDTGIGIAPDRLERIFEPFTQADASMSRRFGGSGLGTTISRQLVELMHGRIWVDSTEGVGSTFHVTLPLLAAPSLAQAAPAPTHAPAALPPLRILVADDVPENRDLLEAVLGHLGHHVQTACDGHQAVARHAAEDFDVILMDVQMPLMDGLSASRLIRAQEQAQGRQRTHIIALTASVFQEDRHAAFDAGMDGFAIKPVDMPALVQEMARLTGHGPASGLGAPPAPAPTPAATRPAADEALRTDLIDTAQGLQRWSDPQAYAQALRQFAQAQQALLGPAADLSATALLALAHRLRGAAANLALPALAQSAQTLQHACHDPHPGALQPPWQALQRTLRDTLSAIDALHHDPKDPHGTPPNAEPLTPRALNEAEQLTLRTLAERLATGFQKGERLDDTLQRFATLAQGRVPADTLDALLLTVDDFDFAAAQRCLRQLRAHLKLDAPLTTEDRHAAL